MDGDFFENQAFLKAIENRKKNGTALPDGLARRRRCYTHNTRTYALVEMAKKGLTKVFVHCFMKWRCRAKGVLSKTRRKAQRKKIATVMADIMQWIAIIAERGRPTARWSTAKGKRLQAARAPCRTAIRRRWRIVLPTVIFENGALVKIPLTTADAEFPS